MPLIPIGLMPLGSRYLFPVQLLTLLDVAVRADDLSVRPKEEEDARDVGTSYSKFHQRRRAMHRSGEWRSVVLPVLELHKAGGNKLVECIILTS